MLEAPAAAALIEAFVNTVDVELGTDDLTAPARLREWLVERALLAGSARVTTADLALALRLRDGLREALGGHVGDVPDPELVRRADEALGALPLRFELTAEGGRGAFVPAPELPPARAALAALPIAWGALVTTGEAARLKRCPEHACAWVFWDASKNHSRRWCSMRVCGNRTKARRYAARQEGRAEAEPVGPTRSVEPPPLDRAGAGP
jgi:predicted RNA-binding Zn ribbon-like protein